MACLLLLRSLILLLLLVLLDHLSLLWGQHLKHGWIVHHLFESGWHRWQLLLLLLLFLLAGLAHSQRKSLLIAAKQLVGGQGQTLLHVDHHGGDLLAQLRLIEFSGELRVLARDTLTDDKRGHFVSERVSIVFKDMVSLLGVLF